MISLWCHFGSVGVATYLFALCFDGLHTFGVPSIDAGVMVCCLRHPSQNFMRESRNETAPAWSCLQFDFARVAANGSRGKSESYRRILVTVGVRRQRLGVAI
jgi:hypothetical protein